MLQQLSSSICVGTGIALLSVDCQQSLLLCICVLHFTALSSSIILSESSCIFNVILDTQSRWSFQSVCNIQIAICRQGSLLVEWVQNSRNNTLITVRQVHRVMYRMDLLLIAIVLGLNYVVPIETHNSMSYDSTNFGIPTCHHHSPLPLGYCQFRLSERPFGVFHRQLTF